MKKLLSVGLKPKILSLPESLFNVKMLYWLCAFLFALQVTRVALVTFSPSEQLNSPAFSFILYLVFLVLYALRQIIDKIKGKVGKKMRGWIFVLLWLFFVIALCVTQKVTVGRYKVPSAAFENLVVVISVFCGRNITDFIWQRKARGRKTHSRHRPILTRKGIPNGAFRL